MRRPAHEAFVIEDPDLLDLLPDLYAQHLSVNLPDAVWVYLCMRNRMSVVICPGALHTALGGTMATAHLWSFLRLDFGVAVGASIAILLYARILAMMLSAPLQCMSVYSSQHVIARNHIQ